MGLLPGLVVTAAEHSYTASGDELTGEASSLAALYRNVGSLPDPARAELQTVLRDHTRKVIDVSLPWQRKAVVPVGADKA
jgi:hypothetical protein